MADISTEFDSAAASLGQAVFSQPVSSSDSSKVTLRPIASKTGTLIQAEWFQSNKAFHKNMSVENAVSYIRDELSGKYRQVLIVSGGTAVQYILKRDGTYKRTGTSAAVSRPGAPASHDRAKNRVLSEGDAIPALVDLGIFTQDYKIIKAKYDKFKQINRFVELVDDEFKNLPSGSEFTILDFGCGKSYLTFILYWYFAVKRGVNVSIIGYDLKEDVVANCKAVAARYGYDRLSFHVADVTKDALYDRKIDMVVTLHACDIATDYALDYAIKKGAKHIFSVPCCQHEVNLSIHSGGDLDILLRHGIIKERVSALLTDSIRASLLEDAGYSVDMIEFIDFEHSPKNLMIRAKLTHTPSAKNRAAVLSLQQKYGFEQSLIKLTEK